MLQNQVITLYSSYAGNICQQSPLNKGQVCDFSDIVYSSFLAGCDIEVVDVAKTKR